MTFQVGDRVRVDDASDTAVRGRTGRIVCVYPDGLGYDVRPDDGPYSHWNVHIDDESCMEAL